MSRGTQRPRRRTVVAASVAALALAGGTTATVTLRDPGPATSGVVTAAVEVPDGSGIWDAGTVHDVAVEVDEAAVATMIDTYQESGDKEWIEATATIDGATFEQVGLRLKGNSSLRGVTDDADPAELPWLLRLDEYVDGQQLDGWTDFVVRSNNTETALNEAVALDLLAETGLASEHAVATSFSVNGGEARLRLVVQALDEAWERENFSTEGLLYKSEAEGDWSWRGDDPDSYADVFDQETGEEDLTPLIELLDLLNNGTDAELEEELPDRLDVEAFARYLAFEELVGNADDIDGPGNNSYLRYDAESGGFTVVAWDHNLAFGGLGGPGDGGPGGGPGAFPDGERPEGMPTDLPEGMPEELPEGMPTELPEGMEPPAGTADGERPEGGGMRGGSNVLVERFTAVEEWADLVEQARADLAAELYASGLADEVIDRWAALLTDEAGDLVDAATVTEEADAIRTVVAEAS
ncbi:CotH kinase family protein [Nocardioides terrigena]|uniref:CotH kinase family protein n=1 Tax=Nocardioides terrigena TaxID=424797 RepID=UPI00131EE525|nr:CotH kinase family protein [Nocardioides terrigena]